jgi:hypothetical protein
MMIFLKQLQYAIDSVKIVMAGSILIICHKLYDFKIVQSGVTGASGIEGSKKLSS